VTIKYFNAQCVVIGVFGFFGLYLSFCFDVIGMFLMLLAWHFALMLFDVYDNLPNHQYK